jgi:hypothetical protein
MTVLFENMQFLDWRTSEKNGQWTDVFIQRISPQAGLPPLEYGLGMYRLAALLMRKRRSASLWVQVDGPGRCIGKPCVPFCAGRASCRLP